MTKAEVDQLLRSFADTVREHAIMLLDPDGNFVWCNHVTENLFGITCDQLSGRPLSFLFTEEDQKRGLPALELDIARSNSSAENDRWLRRADGWMFWASGATTCLRDADGRILGFGKLLRNRTDLKEQLDALRNTADALRERDEQHRVFLSTLSHELRNPLAPLSNAAGLLRVLPKDSPEQVTCLDIVDRQLALMTRLVNDLLDVARIGAGKIELATRPAVLQDILQQAVDAVRPGIRDHRHRIELLVPPVPIPILADEQRLLQVFTNLVANAVKYTPDGGSIWVKAGVESGEAVARVQDDGLGIAPDMLPRIFELFTQADVSRTRSEGGLGIGLSVVRDLVRLHGGSVQVRSDGLGLGSEFTVRLPLGERGDADRG